MHKKALEFSLSQDTSWKHQTLSEEEKISWLRLIRTQNVGPITFYELLRRFGTASQALEEIPHLAQRGGARQKLVPYSRNHALKEMDSIQAYGARLIYENEPSFPQILKHLPDCPPLLTIKGALQDFNHQTIGIVGARNASLNGKKFAEKTARELGIHHFTIASGLARGIDTHAHRGSLKTGTIAVVAGGIDVVYPQENKALYEKILQKGAIVAESPFGVDPQSTFFPKRNRLISGLSMGVVVVEAAYKSGSLLTAKFALDQNRHVFAVPGSPFDPRCQGTNDLIRQGATLIQKTSEIVEDILPLLDKNVSQEPSEPYGEEQLAIPEGQPYEKIREDLLTNLSYTPTRIDELIRHCQASPSEVLHILLELELAGRLERHPGNKVAFIET